MTNPDFPRLFEDAMNRIYKPKKEDKMKYCGLIVDDCVLEPTTIGKTLVWDFEDRCLSMTNLEEKQLELVKGHYSHAEIRNISVSEIGLIVEAFRCLNISKEINMLSSKIDRLLDGFKSVL